VDEVNPNGTITKGKIWSFTVADFLIVDDFELYDNLGPSEWASNSIFEKWADGLG
jgi:hypothetical protein